MRKRFDQQLSLGATPISEVKIRTKGRDEMPPVLVALQTIFTTPELNEKIFSILEDKILKGKKNTGRNGMDLWHILVLGVVRHACNTNWDKLEYYANNDASMRSIMGLHFNGFSDDFLFFEYQNILDNVGLLDAETLNKINAVVVGYGMGLLKKKGDEALELKTDSFALETNVHFPTDLNLLWDSLRVMLRLLGKLLKKQPKVKGWRKLKSIVTTTKSIYRSCSQAVFKGRKEDHKKKMVRLYLGHARGLAARVGGYLVEHPNVDIQKYHDYVVKFTDQIERRLINGEAIPSGEKTYSIFEEHTEWLNKGKRTPELGNTVLITTDQNHLILDYKIVYKEKDASQIAPLLARLKGNYPGQKIGSLSTDKGFYSKVNKEGCLGAGIENVVMPKKGKLNEKEYESEHTKTFVSLRRRHSAVESNINMLEHHGLNRCPDRGIAHYEKYVALSVLAYNLHHIGNELVRQGREKERLAEKRREYRQAA
jgi:transposase, IS5 family